MGDIKTHGIVGHQVLAALRNVLPSEDYQYVELGNYLTDVSQFRDPTAMHMAKPRLLTVALEVHRRWQLNWAKVPDWLDDLMGRPAQLHGSLADFFKEVILSATYMFGSALQIPDAETERLFTDHFTQYYPHEHLDFPPLTNLRGYMGHGVQRGDRGLITYLEEQSQFVSEMLTSAEVAWKNSRRTHPDQQHESRHDVLVALGHVLHAVEDFYFHSNFAELHWWQSLESEHNRSGAGQDWGPWFDTNALDRRTEGTWIRLKRKLYRRTRFPNMVAGPNGVPTPSQTTSFDAKDLVYTGGFGQADLYHTFYGALVGLQEGLAQFGVTAPWDNTELTLVRHVMKQELRRRLVSNEDYKERVIEQHREQLAARRYETSIDSAVAADRMTQAAGDALKRAFDIDRRVSDRYPDTPGLGGFLIELATEVQKEADVSRRRSEALDRANHIRDARSDNRASGEGIGNHALLAKDSVRSGPFRGEAVALAIHASTNLALLMAQEVLSAGNPNGSLWWDGALRHYLRFPRHSPSAWEQAVMSRQRPAGSERVDIPHTLGDSARVVRLPAEHAQLRNRLQQDTRQRLERRYQALEAVAERRWRTVRR